jgi:hypothetical protein
VWSGISGLEQAGCVRRQWLGRLVAPGNRQRPACRCSLRSNDRGPCIPCLTHFKTAFPASTEGCGTKTLSARVLSPSARRPKQHRRMNSPQRPQRNTEPGRIELQLFAPSSFVTFVTWWFPCFRIQELRFTTKSPRTQRRMQQGKLLSLAPPSPPAGKARFSSRNAGPLAPPAAAGQNSGFRIL